MSAFVHPDEIRSRFSAALSAMYRAEVPQYGDLLSLVADINAATLKADAGNADRLAASGELARLSEERHGAIRVGTADELATIARAFAVMGMEPVSYYNLAPAGVPVHSTAFRPVDPAALARNPFRVFTSLLRLELIEDEALRAEAAETLARRDIFATCRRIELPVRPGEATLLHRLTIHGVAAWKPQDEAPPEGRMIAYLRPQLSTVEAWLKLP